MYIYVYVCVYIYVYIYIYRLYAQLFDHAGRAVSSERERAFFVRHEHPREHPQQGSEGGKKKDSRRDPTGWFCDPSHCLAPETGGGWDGVDESEVAREGSAAMLVQRGGTATVSQTSSI